MKKTIGERMKEIRTEQGFPQKAVADHLKLHRSNYSKIENNIQKLTPEQIIMFCEFFDISSDYLLGLDVRNKRVYNNESIEKIEKRLKEINDLLK